jgi:tetratricopeptide (TPR) repeat protein
MQALRVLDRFSPSEAYLLTLLAAQHLEMIREEQLLTYLDRGMGIANRDARTALLESALLRADEIEELDRFLERKLGRGPRDFRAICRSMFTPAVERTLRITRNEDARRLTLDTTVGSANGQANGATPESALAEDDSEWDSEAERKRVAASHPWIKAGIALGLLAIVAWTVIMPAVRDHIGRPPFAGNAPPREALAPHPKDMQAIVRVLCLNLVSQKDVVAQIKHDPNLTDSQREEALLCAEDKPAIAELLNDSAWDTLRYAGNSQHHYERCIELALEACRLAPTDGMILNTLGVAQYRVGQYKQAVETLGQSYAINRTGEFGEHPADVAFLCMSYAKLDRTTEARDEFDKLKRLTRLRFWHDDLECQAFYREASEVMQQLAAKKAAIRL